MVRNVFLVDITEHRGLEQSAISSVQAYASNCNPELIDWFKLSHQVRPELGNGGTVFSGLETGLQLWPRISQRIVELSKGDYAGSVFHVFSYDPSILTESRKLSQPDMIVTTTPLAVLITKWRLSCQSSTNYVRKPAYLPQQQISSPVLPLEEALELTKRVLKRYGHTSQQTALLQVQLRPLLTREDARAKKNPRDRSSSRLVSSIIAEGIRTGCIRQYNVENIPGTDRIWLDESARSSDQGARTSLHIAGGSGVIQASADSVAAPAVPVLAITGSPTGVTPKSAETNAEPAKCSTDAGKKRTKVIKEALKKAGVFSPKQQRDKLFDALRTCLPPGGEAKTLLVLSREIRQAASKPSADPEFLHWHPATDGMVGLLLGAGVLIDKNGESVRSGLFANGTPICSFQEQLEDSCEAFMLETAIKELKNITKHDKIPLAHALFWKDASQSSRDEVEERLEYVMTLLQDRLAETSEGVWYIKSRGTEARAAAASVA